MHLKIITPLKTALDTGVLGIQLPVTEGEMEILPGHAALISSVANGELVYRAAADGARKSLFVGGGFLQVEHDHILLVTDTALEANDINTDTVEEAIARAKEAIKNASSVMSREELTFLEASISKQMAMLDFRKKYRR